VQVRFLLRAPDAGGFSSLAAPRDVEVRFLLRARDGDQSTNLPTFLIIGAPKCGTTSLSRYLGAHPEVFFTTPKEPKFFTTQWDRGLDWYRALFADGASVVARGEGSVAYGTVARHPDVPGRIRRLVPDAKLVYLVREPVQRIRSHYAFEVLLGLEERPFEVAVRDSDNYVNASRYGFNASAYLEHFPREQLLVVSADELRSHREATVRRVFAFIGVDPDYVPRNLDEEDWVTTSLRFRGKWSDRALHVAGRTPLHFLPSTAKRRMLRVFQKRLRHPDLSPELEHELWKIFTPDLERLREIVGPDFSLWGRA
jgi:hypothetical protein